MLSGNYALTSPEQRRGGGKCFSVGSLLCCAVCVCMHLCVCMYCVCVHVYVCACICVCVFCVCMCMFVHLCLFPQQDVFAKGEGEAGSVCTEVP